MSWGVSHCFILFGTFWVSWTWVTISFPILGMFSTIIFLSIFSWPICLLLLDSYESNVGVLNIVPEVSEVFLISFNYFFLFPLCFIYFHHSIFYLSYPIFCLSFSTVGSLQSVLISFIALFIID